MLFSTDIKELKGVGSVKAQAFHGAGVDTVGALLRYYPRTYEDWSSVTPIRETTCGEYCCVKALVCESPKKIRIPGGRLLFKTTVTDGAGLLNLTFFNNKYIGSMLKENEEYYFYGKISSDRYGGREMLSPQFSKAAQGAGIRPVYPQTAALNSRFIERCQKTALEQIKEIPDYLPEKIRSENSLCTLDEAIRDIHFPESYEALEKARNRLIFDELFILQLGLLSIKNRTGRLKTRCVINEDYTDEFIKSLPFEMTNAQKRAVREAADDMKRDEPMNRLLQGDVGSGKTAAAAAIIYSAAKNGYQSALMAPTEVLAQQHYRTFLELFKGTGIKISLLTGGVKASEKREIKASLADGETQLAIGTHALLQKDVEFSRLGLVITDEQHRFGVAQRAAIAAKGDNPHIYVMSATPIPRTLALIMYGDLSVSVLDEMPPGRQKTRTYAVTSDYHERIYAFIKKHLDRGLQGYIVCPLVDESDSEMVSELLSAQEYYNELSHSVFSGYSVGLMHGKMKPAEKDEIMRRFSEGEIQLLVSTVVIEVGVDVPNAAVMVIENAERFGLSQLHQLRGRIGRGKDRATCILVSDAKGEVAKQRLQIMCETDDGFKIADADLKMRGPGDFFGKRQHGLPELRIADIMTDTQLLLAAQRAAENIIRDDRELEKPENVRLKKQVGKMLAGMSRT